MVAVRIGQMGRPAVMDQHAAVAGDHSEGSHGLATPPGVEELQRDLAGRADVDPVVFPVNPQRGLVDMHCRQGDDLLDGRALPGGQGLEQGPAFRAHLPSGAEVLELLFQGIEFLELRTHCRYR